MTQTSFIKAFALIIISTVFFSFIPSSNNKIEDDVLTYTNLFRSSKGLNPLTANKVLNVIAQQHSANMASGKVKFGHDGFAKRNAAASKQLSIRSFAENVAYGVTTGEAAVNLWKNSDGHRNNMMGNFSKIGIGVAKDKQGRIYYTQVFSD